ncbi:hypothetical protein ABIB62_003069 [Mucilaginibacter sp. UYP25]|uniref:hypothetical protein n=1 Tax=unclassified Mucilaginibacter TaxID=2617802 RepID=UPI003397EDF4
MKTFKNISFAIVLLLAATLTSCKKDGNAQPGDQSGSLINSAQLFLDDNSTVSLESNTDVKASYADGKLKVAFNQNGNDVTLEIPNYDINAESAEYNNGTAALSVVKSGKTYNSSMIFIPVIVGNPPRPVFVTNELLTIKTNNIKVNQSITDISILIVSGSELITVPVSNGNAPTYGKITFLQGDGGRPNMIFLRIKK